MNKICFVIPTWHYFFDPLKLQPYWELYYATILRNRLGSSDSVDVMDLRGVSWDALPKVISLSENRNIYIYWIMKTGDAMEVYSIVKMLRHRDAQSRHVVGGYHAEVCTDECKMYFDSVIVGPGEQSIYAVVNDIRNGVSKKVYQQDYRESPFDDTPFPMRDFLPENRVINNDMFKQYGNYRATMLYFSRGCMFNCAYCFCNSPNFLQARSQEMMRAELRYLKEEYRIQAVLLKDEIAIHPDSKISKTVFDSLGESELVWRGQTTVNANEEQLKMASESGCKELAIGVETVDESVMKIINKSWQNEKKIRMFVESARKYGIKIKMCLILGLPGEPLDIIDRTIRFLEDLKPDYVSLSGFCPVPGSLIFKNPQNYGIKWIDRDWSKHAHLLFRFSGDEDFGLPFEYERQTSWGNAFTRAEISANILSLQRWLEEHRMIY